MVSIRTVVTWGLLVALILGAAAGVRAFEVGEITAETGLTKRFIESTGEWPAAEALEGLLPQEWRGKVSWPESAPETAWDEPALVPGGGTVPVVLPQRAHNPVLGSTVEAVGEEGGSAPLAGEFEGLAAGDLLCSAKDPEVVLEFAGAYGGAPVARPLAGAQPAAGTKLNVWRPAKGSLVPHVDRRAAAALVQALVPVDEHAYLRLAPEDGEMPEAGRLLWILRPYPDGRAVLVGAAVVVWTDERETALAWPFRTALEPQPGDRVVGAQVPQ